MDVEIREPVTIELTLRLTASERTDLAAALADLPADPDSPLDRLRRILTADD